MKNQINNEMKKLLMKQIRINYTLSLYISSKISIIASELHFLAPTSFLFEAINTIKIVIIINDTK